MDDAQKKQLEKEEAEAKALEAKQKSDEEFNRKTAQEIATMEQNRKNAASEFSNGQIFSYQKGRGIGDCFSQTEWAWNGQHFVKSYQFDAGQCKGFAGSAWEMPSFVSKVE